MAFLRPRLMGLALLLASTAWSPAVDAAGLDLGSGGGSGGPLEVLADNGIEWQQSAKRFVARGNAVAARGSVQVRADELVALYRDKGEAPAGGEAPKTGGLDIYRLEAKGGVRISSASETVTGAVAVYDLDKGIMTLTAAGPRAPVVLTTPNETLKAGEAIVYDVRRQVAEARGGAVVEQNGRTLEAKTLSAKLETVGGKTQLSSLTADGGVTITTPQESAHGSQGNYDAKTGIATLSGSVKIVRGNNELNGQKAVVNMKTGISTLTGGGPGGRARAVLTPDEPGAGSR